MRYFRRAADRRLVVDDGEQTYDLTAAAPDIASFTDLARTASDASESIDAVAADRLHDAPPIEFAPGREAGVPVDAEEVWAAGVTYERSEQAREEESSASTVYIQVYGAERPEIFFKATPSRIVGPREQIGVRGDSDWNVPEPELGIVLYDGDPVGYTIGNDVSSRSIEGENPLYLPQAKIYSRCCALGPCVASPETVGDPHDVGLTMRIHRDGRTAYADETNTSEMVRSCDELVSYLVRHNAVPEVAVLLTGTCLVPPDEFTLEPGDTVSIDLDGIGVLENDVAQV